MATSAIKVEGLCKSYTLGGTQWRHGTLYDVLANSLRAPFGQSKSTTHEPPEQFWALNDVSFEVKPGEVVGIIGRNGAGKSTMLKVLSRITAPTRGRVELRGRLASLLEVGTGFHAELSGRENIFLNGALLGMTRREVVRKFDEIVAFAEVDRFIDTPVKRYSSGMYVRLAFAVAAHLDVDILLVDEVLAVGDAAFQRKSLGKMGDVAKGGRTVVFVSHNLSAIIGLCARALLFDGGQCKIDGPTSETLSAYESGLSEAGGSLQAAHFDGPLTRELVFQELACTQDGAPVTVVDPTRAFSIEVRGMCTQSFDSLGLNIALYRDGFHIATCHDTPTDVAMRAGAFTSRFEIAADVLRPGRYTIGIGASSTFGRWIWGGDVAALDFSENLGGRAANRVAGAVALPYAARRVQ